MLDTLKQYFILSLTIGLYIALVAVLLVILEVALQFFEVPSYLFPLPSKVMTLLVQEFSFFFYHTSITMFEAIVGFLIGNIAAFLFALMLVRFPAVEKIGLASAIALKATPVVVLAPLFIIWFGNGVSGKIVMSALICFFPMLVNSLVGMRSIDPEVMNYMRSLGASSTQILLKVRVPSSVPFVLAAAKTSSTIAVVGAVIAELAGSDIGIGSIFITSIWELRTDRMFAAIVSIAAAGIAFYALVSLAPRILARWGFKETANVV